MNKSVREKNSEKTIKVEFSNTEENKPEELKKSEDAEKKEKRASGKKEKKDWEKEYKELYDKYVRLHAEFENFKRRITKDKQEAIRYANQELIRQILPFVDNLERSLQHADESKNIDALKEGIEMTIKDFLKTLEKLGLETIQSEGEPFDPNVHEAIMQEERDDMEPNTVVQELQRGYKLHGRVIRPATVTVSKKKDS
ncbi:MAG: nucleotide exchange factor GrpE [Deltaproteobacteria bacterium]|nr:nucleotide exchange factor GrpE [Deltaproteobacteria bacterium]